MVRGYPRALEPNERATRGVLFLAFQYPVEVPNCVATMTFLKAAINSAARTASRS